MMNLFIIGYLGGDAEIKSEHGVNYLQFRVAHTRRWVDETGERHESTDWVTCFMRGKVENLKPYLVRGQLVYVSGMPSARAYPSEKLRKYVAALSLNVDRVELLGSSVKDTVKDTHNDTADNKQENTMPDHF